MLAGGAITAPHFEGGEGCNLAQKHLKFAVSSLTAIIFFS